MCGIAGVIAEREEDVRLALAAMTAAQHHRGPDDFGQTLLPVGRRVLGLGHRRLSIIDLTSAGHQPMVHPQSGDQLIFNGEIYNFALLREELKRAGETFAGHSDTEVLLHALTRYGPAVIDRLEGMFAFAFYDARQQSVLLARDPLGIKPLYVAQPAPGVFLFASEVRAILASKMMPRELDPQGLAGVLAYGCPQQPLTLIKGVRSFPAGAHQVFHPDADGADVGSGATKYWNFPTTSNVTSETQALESVRSTLDAAVRDHLVADVPVGIFLSSGLDSTILAALASRHTPHLRSFTVGFAEHPDLSEAPAASETARLFGLEHTNISIRSAAAEAAAVEWLDALDQPSMDGLNVFIISKAVRAQGIKVALSGQGGDELFGGYPSFQDVPRLRRMMGAARWLPTGLRRRLSGLLMAHKPRAVRDKFRDMLGTDSSVLELYLQRRRAMSMRQLHELDFDPRAYGLTENCQPAEALADVRHDHDVIREISHLETRFYQNNMLLRDGDANSMAHSLEIRVPMLDRRMLDLVLPMPGRVRLPAGRADKHLLRRAFSQYLREELIAQRKRGFTLPIRRWMTGSMRELCEESLKSLASTGLLGEHGVQSIWRDFLAEPESPIWTRAFTLCVLGRYTQKVLRG